jgi:hypothetical protein
MSCCVLRKWLTNPWRDFISRGLRIWSAFIAIQYLARNCSWILLFHWCVNAEYTYTLYLLYKWWQDWALFASTHSSRSIYHNKGRWLTHAWEIYVWCLMTMNIERWILCRWAYAQLSNVGLIRRYLTTAAANCSLWSSYIKARLL